MKTYKTSWKVALPDDRRRRLLAARQRETGVKWVWYSTGPLMRMLPVLDATIEPDMRHADVVRAALSGKTKTFIDLAQETSLTLREVMEAVRWLTKAEPLLCVVEVCRTAHGAAVRLSTSELYIRSLQRVAAVRRARDDQQA